MTRLLLGLALAVGLHAETVYLSPHGKTYHKSTQCMALHRTAHVLSADRAAAEGHGLHQCHICYREHAPKKTAETRTWASEVGK